MRAKLLTVTINNNWLLVALVIFGTVMAIYFINSQSNVRPAENVVSDINFLIDESGQLDIKAAMAKPVTDWQDNTHDFLSFGMSTKPYWFRLVVPKQQSQQQRLLVVEDPLLDKVSIWFEQSADILLESHTGDSLPFSQRPLLHKNFIFPLPITEKPLTAYIRVQTTGSMRLPVSIWTESDFIPHTNLHSTIMGLFLGFMTALALINLFCFMTTKEAIFAVYFAYIMFLALVIGTLNGLGYQYLWPNSPWYQQHALIIFANLTGAFSVVFCSLLLNIKYYSATLNQVLKAIVVTYLVCAIASLITPLSMLVNTFLIVLLLSWVLIYGMGMWLWYKGNTLAGVFTLAWSIFFISALVICLDHLNLLKLNVPSDYLLVLAGGIGVLSLALILAVNHKDQRAALFDAQNLLLAKTQQEKNEQDEILAQQELTKEDLEYKFQERTLELEIALRELSEINRELQEKNTLDALTGVRNRSYFDKKYLAEIRRSRRERTPLSIVMLDIDHFKSINDKYGHLVGDECIKSVALTLKNALKRPSDDLCRYGGEEFVLILPSTKLAGATSLVEQVRQVIAETPIKADGFSISLTISAGIATAVANPHEEEDVILAAADQQLYQAKNFGRNNVKGVLLNDDVDTPQE